MHKGQFVKPRIVTRPVPKTPGLAGLPELLQRLYASRGISSRDELDYNLTYLPDYTALLGMDAACDLLELALASKHSILVVGDFDVDGATSAALVCEVLEVMGAQRVGCFIPNRVEHGYGLSARVVEAIRQEGIAPGLLITVDNGISSIDGVKAAQADGWQVLVTDHHLPGPELPPADAIVNPNQPGCGAFGRSLAGVGVAFYLMLALRGRLRRQGWQTGLPHMGDYLDLVALGTVADVVPMDRLNRLLVSQGLRRIRAGRARPGIAALAAAAGRDIDCLTPADIGFGIAPRLNAAGRLEDMRIGVACLRATERYQADTLASRLSAINDERRIRQAEMQAEAEQALALHKLNGEPPSGLVVFSPNWHQGIVGLVAGRLCERYRRPVIAFAKTNEGDALKGSARSIDGVHIRDVLATMDANETGLIQRFGGHAKAAGLTLESTRLNAFRQAFETAVADQLTAEMLDDSVITDGALSDAELNLPTAALLRDAGPWGSEFEAPLFYGDFEVLSSRLLKDKHLKMVVQPKNGNSTIDAIAFNHRELAPQGSTIRLVYRLEVNRFRGHDSVNLIVEQLFRD